ncbi:hypothetical protein MZO42_19430 [Sphingomonas psychrotolerans]|uniref:Uncharacterized protein n=1 Tax=Sphingomonas psychrotolerans TaxID=1327635 RepID=A0ABU3NAQ3_9SPHN|nr:hypothetical protein [Sphingomonas psychrotolerans]MDT8760877.1 hypothetical protein [Sphingomonas psychrotolerans]
MAFLSSLFGGGDDSEGTSASNSDFWSDLDAVVSIDASNETYSHSVDEDGSSETYHSAQDFGADLDLGSVLSSMTDSFGDFEG